MKEACVCNTQYHLLITLLMLDENHPENYRIILDNQIVNADKYQLKIQELFGIEVLICDIQKIYSNWKSLSLNKTDIVMDDYISNTNKFILYNDFTNFAYYLHKNKIPFVLREDGYNYQTIYNADEYTWLDEIKMAIKRRIKGIPRHKGYSKYCVEINVNSMNGIKKDSRYSKFMAESRGYFFDNMSKSMKENLFLLFDVQPIKIKGKSALVITQPLHVHNIYVYSEKEQFDFYHQIVTILKNDGYNVYIKIHPRDKIDYSRIASVEILESQIPLELMDLLMDRSFEIGITYSSTALSFVGKVDRKIILSKTEEFSKHNRIVI
ncbi:hypothetical protein KG090_00085 [Carnobacteriaceae bacterium zg-ZUI240]|nr:hypothetical protein [Carnobacteriaceae bacterium zg-ZUI240]